MRDVLPSLLTTGWVLTTKTNVIVYFVRDVFSSLLTAGWILTTKTKRCSSINVDANDHPSVWMDLYKQQRPSDDQA